MKSPVKNSLGIFALKAFMLIVTAILIIATGVRIGMTF